MIYFETKSLVIRDLEENDVQPLVAGEIAQGWTSTRGKLDMRLEDAAAGRCVALCAVYDGTPVGYNHVYLKADGPFADTDWPEIVDFAVLECMRGHGIGTALMDAAEKLAAETAQTVCLGVGLHSGYGAAQRMYVKRGYVPDGSGVWYEGKVCTPYSACQNDDDLVLYFLKNL